MFVPSSSFESANPNSIVYLGSSFCFFCFFARNSNNSQQQGDCEQSDSHSEIHILHGMWKTNAVRRHSASYVHIAYLSVAHMKYIIHMHRYLLGGINVDLHINYY